MNHRSVQLAVLSLLLSAGAVSAQRQGTVRGLVTDKDFSAPLGEVDVTLVELNRSTRTSEEGIYSMAQVPAGTYNLVFSKDGYLRQSTTVEIRPGRVREQDMALSGEFEDMEEYVVQDLMRLGGGTEAGLLQLRFESPALMDSISADQMSQAGVSDAASALRLVAGASVADGKTAVVRGLPDRYVSSQLNGIRLPSAGEDKRAVELDQYPAAVIESIQVAKTFTPDQQGDASGGAVDVRLKGVPDKAFFFRYSVQAGHNSNHSGRDNFVSYEGGGVSHWGMDDGRRDPQVNSIGASWMGAVGTDEIPAPLDYKWSVALGGKLQLGDKWKVGGLASFFYERDSSSKADAVDDSWWRENPGEDMKPQTSQGTFQDGDFKTNLFDIQQGTQSVQWGTLGVAGIESELHKLQALVLYTRTAEDEATLATDTRGKQYYYPGYNPDDPTSPGHEQPDGAPYLSLETLEYTERTAETKQLSGEHTFGRGTWGVLRAPTLDWTFSRSKATMAQPDKRQFGSLWVPARTVSTVSVPAIHLPYKPGANFTLGNLQRIFKSIEEDSEQYAGNLKFPFDTVKGREGFLKLGVFEDRVQRSFDQDTYSNFNDNSSYSGPFENRWSQVFPSEDHPITESEFDVDYAGKQEIFAYYAMLDLPVSKTIKLVGGVRFEKTEISIVNDPESEATWYPPGTVNQVQLNPGDGDADFSQDDVLPSVALEWKPSKTWTMRASYNETTARQTFKELSPILQQEFAGGPIFIGNPGLEMSALKNYDVRIDYKPYEGGLISASWFYKEIQGPIEYVQQIATDFDYTTAVNYPEGTLSGYEFELRQKLGEWWSGLEGFSIGANATLIDSEVTLPEDEQARFAAPELMAPMEVREMTNAPEHLFNYFVTWESSFGTQIGVFYIIQGDTLKAGAGESDGNFVPSLYDREYGTLNLSLAQQFGDLFKVRLRAKNVTDPEIETVYRSIYTGPDVINTSYRKGIDYSVSIGNQVTF